MGTVNSLCFETNEVKSCVTMARKAYLWCLRSVILPKNQALCLNSPPKNKHETLWKNILCKSFNIQPFNTVIVSLRRWRLDRKTSWQTDRQNWRPFSGEAAARHKNSFVWSSGGGGGGGGWWRKDRERRPRDIESRGETGRERDDVNYKDDFGGEKLREVRGTKKIIQALFPWLRLRQTFLGLVSLRSF